MSCKVKVRRRDTIPIVQIIGELAGSDSAKALNKLSVLARIKAPKIVFDLSETGFIDSHGLGVLVFIWRRLEGEGREVVFYCPDSEIQELFTSTNLATVFKMVDSLEMI